MLKLSWGYGVVRVRATSPGKMRPEAPFSPLGSEAGDEVGDGILPGTALGDGSEIAMTGRVFSEDGPSDPRVREVERS
jgi:hypothetical protein